MKVDFALKLPAKVWAAVAAIAVVLAVAVGFIVHNRLTATTMNLIKTEGTVAVSDEKGTLVTPKSNLKLYNGYGVDTGQVSYAWIDLDDVKLVKMDENSEIEIQKDGHKLELLLNSGNLFFNVTEPLADDETMTIRTSTMIVGIRGTCGWVEDSGKDGSRVFLLEGKVETKTVDTGETVEVSAGEMAQVFVNEDGQTKITVQPYAEEFIAPFVLAELQKDGELSAAILEASGLDTQNPPDPAERLRGEYQQIIAEQQLFDGLNPGVCYANYVDVDNDEIPELLLIGLTPSGKYDLHNYGWDCSMELYASDLGYVKKYDLGIVDGITTLDEIFTHGSVSLSQIKGHTYLHGSYMDGQNGFEDFFMIERGSVSKVAALATLHVDAYETGLTNFDEAITADEFNEIWHKYTDDEVTILSSRFSLDPVADWGLLEKPQPSSDVQRRLSFLGILDSGVMRYVKLVDINEDGVEDLLTIQNVSIPTPDGWSTESTSFVAYIWDGTSLQKTSLTQHDSSFSEPYMSWSAQGIYKEKLTGKFYVRYLVEDPLYPSNYVFESISDCQVYPYHMGREGYLNGLQYVPETEEEWAEIYAGADESERNKQATETEISNQFELVEEIGGISGEPIRTTIGQVRQQLMS